MEEEDPKASTFLDPSSPHFQVLPTFPLPLTSKALLNVTEMPSGVMAYNIILHGELFLKLHRPFKPEGRLNLQILPLDVLDKLKGTLYIWNSKYPVHIYPAFLQGPLYIVRFVLW
jgi:hypothetical protein